jgi:hypothetical protein
MGYERRLIHRFPHLSLRESPEMSRAFACTKLEASFHQEPRNGADNGFVRGSKNVGCA